MPVFDVFTCKNESDEVSVPLIRNPPVVNRANYVPFDKNYIPLSFATTYSYVKDGVTPAVASFAVVIKWTRP